MKCPRRPQVGGDTAEFELEHLRFSHRHRGARHGLVTGVMPRSTLNQRSGLSALTAGGAIARGTIPVYLSFHNYLEAAVDQPLPVKRHWIRVRLKAWVGHDLFHGLIANLP